MYLELINYNSKNNIGWWRFCEADFLAYGNAHTDEFYIFDLAQLHRRVEQLPVVKGACADSIGLLIPLDAVRDLIINVI